MRQKRNRKKRSLRPQSAAWTLVIFFFFGLTPAAAAEELTLERALNIAVQKSPAMRQASLQLEISERNLMAQQAGLKSQFSLSLTPYRTSSSRVFNELTSTYNTQTQTRTGGRFTILQPIKWTDATLSVSNSFNWQEATSSFAGGDKQQAFSNSLTVSLSQPLFTYNRLKMQIKELELALENTQLSYAIQRLQIERQVTQQFLNLYFSRMSIQISQEEYKNATENLEIIQSKVEAGISAPEELYQADITRDNSRASLENKLMQHENSLDAFKILLGLEVEDLIDVSADVQQKIIEVDLDAAIAHGLENRMELRQKDIDIQNAMHDLIVAGAENEFRGSLSLSLGLTGTDPRFGGIYDQPNTDHLVALTLDIPLFDWGQKKHHLAATRAQIETVKLSAEEEIKGIKAEIREAYRNLQNQKIQIEIAEKNVINAQRTYEINLERYKGGDLSAYDMLLFQTQLTQEQLDRVSALINYKMALLELKIRTLWDFENNRSVLDIKAGELN